MGQAGRGPPKPHQKRIHRGARGALQGGERAARYGCNWSPLLSSAARTVQPPRLRGIREMNHKNTKDTKRRCKTPASGGRVPSALPQGPSPAPTPILQGFFVPLVSLCLIDRQL